jgi:hypothetical protein
MRMNSNCVDTELMPFDLARSILADAGEPLTAELEIQTRTVP